MIESRKVTEKEDGTFLFQITSTNPLLKECLFVYDNVDYQELDYSKFYCDSYILYLYTDENGKDAAEQIENVNSKFISIQVLQEAIRMQPLLIQNTIEEIVTDSLELQESLI